MASKDKAFYSKNTLNVNGKVLELDEPKIMAILNITDDSFYDGGKYIQSDLIYSRVEELIKQGADIIDIGGYSSRPGAIDIDVSLEFERLNKGICIVRSVSKEIPISIDTFRAGLAKKCLDMGADIINDISAGALDREMLDVIAEYKVPYIMMHMRGTPQNMQSYTSYENLIFETMDYLRKKINQLTQIGLKDVIIDMGFGFSKTIEQNYELLRNLELFAMLNAPILVGLSRKSMIYKLLNISPEKALNGTSVLHTIALLKGARILRVHDVSEAKEVIGLLNNFKH